MKEALRAALQALASTPDADDDEAERGNLLAVEFGNALLSILEQSTDEFTGAQVRALNAIAGLLREMSSGDHAELWTPEAVRDHPKWHEVRALAGAALRSLGWADSS
ncbi:MAG TPA: hypothetical protein VJ011_08780 [Steroidobacteraceae bacterium]|nr:hypothetical protein [Steroidobacteraceae bacterium]